MSSMKSTLKRKYTNDVIDVNQQNLPQFVCNIQSTHTAVMQPQFVHPNEDQNTDKDRQNIQNNKYTKYLSM